MGRLYIYLDLPRKQPFHVGKYTSLMDGMGTRVFCWANFWEFLYRKWVDWSFRGTFFAEDGKGLKNWRNSPIETTFLDG